MILWGERPKSGIRLVMRYSKFGPCAFSSRVCSNLILSNDVQKATKCQRQLMDKLGESQYYSLQR